MQRTGVDIMKEKKGKSTSELLEENEKIIKFTIIFCIVYSIIYIGLIIAWIYCKIKGI